MAEDSSKTFDRALLIMALFAALTAVLAGIAAFRGGGASEEAADGEGGPVTASIELAEWSITGDLEIPAGEVTVDVTNTGSVAGDEVVQLYVSYPGSAVDRAEHDLKGFARVHLEPGETRSVLLEVRAADLAYWDVGADAWVVEPLGYGVQVGPTSADLPVAATLTVAGP